MINWQNMRGERKKKRDAVSYTCMNEGSALTLQ